MTNPLDEAMTFLDDDVDNLPDGTTYDVRVPDPAITAVHVQVAWDGSSDADNREDTTLRFTVWVPRDRPTLAQDTARGLRDRLLTGWASDALFRVGRGSGRLPGVDSRTHLPFCTFTVIPAMRVTTPAP